jgi:hypothetical protein
MTPWLVALFAGYVVALALAWYLSPSAPPTAAAVERPAQAVAEPIPVANIPPVVLTNTTPFDESLYVLRLRAGLAGLLLGRRFVDYTIQAIPSNSRSEFSFSWASGILKREPAGPPLLRLQAAERHDLLKRAYIVSDPGTGVEIGRLLPHGADWQIADRYGRPMADVVQSIATFHQTCYSLSAGGEELCRLTAVMGATAMSAEVQVEFLPKRTRARSPARDGAGASHRRAGEAIATAMKVP